MFIGRSYNNLFSYRLERQYVFGSCALLISLFLGRVVSIVYSSQGGGQAKKTQIK
jgi:hypothetical protein